MAGSHIFIRRRSFTQSWEKVRRFAEEAGRDPAELESTNQLPIMVGDSRAEIEGPMNEWLHTEWDYASWERVHGFKRRHGKRR